MERTGILDELIEQGKEWVFVSNIDNLGSSVDLQILQYLCDSDREFLVELTPKTKSDIKGGTLIQYDGTIRLLEVAQVPSQHKADFQSVKKFATFNTNKWVSRTAMHNTRCVCLTFVNPTSLWVNLKALRRLFDRLPNGPDLDIIENPKTTDSGEAVIQLETAMASAIQSFQKSGGMIVPRSRFVPVKATSDLLLAQSEGLYTVRHGQLVMNPGRPFASTPVVKLGPEFAKVADFDKRWVS